MQIPERMERSRGAPSVRESVSGYFNRSADWDAAPDAHAHRRRCRPHSVAVMNRLRVVLQFVADENPITLAIYLARMLYLVAEFRWHNNLARRKP